ncbi:hypothetical protein [Alicyclobacillus dauci]|uniref:Uncharacterized protein n=1 Tax=Alicyclobacillus dauci TaxID=1475485 RepID=A0ABY6Z8B1_9BACL|nr:hypothetical protein [Alicyclobacillus dauci]WAH38496.1 hypothetical protein NZD86_08445 [Alicyclobacillus dauci]
MRKSTQTTWLEIASATSILGDYRRERDMHAEQTLMVKAVTPTGPRRKIPGQIATVVDSDVKTSV